jgi:hypothetical protein
MHLYLGQIKSLSFARQKASFGLQKISLKVLTKDVAENLNKDFKTI